MKLALEKKKSLLYSWAKGETLSNLGRELGIPTRRVRKELGIPAKGDPGIFQFKLNLLAPHLRITRQEVRHTKGGNKQVYLHFLNTEKGENHVMLSGDLISSVKQPKASTLEELLEGRSEEDRDLIRQWARGVSLSRIAKEQGVSRGRLSQRLGLPPASSQEAFGIRLEAVAPHLTLLSVHKSDKSSDIMLEVLDTRNGRTFTHTSSWMFSSLEEDPIKVFFPSQSEVVEKRVRNGTMTLIEGMTQREYAEKIGSSYSTVLVALKGRTEEEAINLLEDYSPASWTLENRVARWLEEEGLEVTRNRKFAGTSYIPDIVVHDKKLVVECDGLFWHSDAVIKDKRYHEKKRAAYLAQGYRSFFFREDELNNKPEVCRSILLNFLGKNTRVFARKTKVAQDSPVMFEKYHLMGKGQGTVYSLFYEDEAVSSLQVKFKSIKDGILNVSRFCSMPHLSVVGGYSKLLAHAIRDKKPKKVQTFVDLRYGDGTYLSSLGWTLENTSLSFAWTDGKGNSYHRMRFRRNSGYKKGCHKVWDCGQAKWMLNIEP